MGITLQRKKERKKAVVYPSLQEVEKGFAAWHADCAGADACNFRVCILTKRSISHGAIGYLKKLSDMEVAGARDLLERLEERGMLRSIFGSKNQ